MRALLALALAAVLLAAGASALHGSPPGAPTPSAPLNLAAADARLRAVLASAAKADQPAADADAQNARLVAADAALDELATIPAEDRAGLAVKAAAVIFVGDYEVQETWRLARSLARDELRFDEPRDAPL